jgi:hypothetical protein
MLFFTIFRHFHIFYIDCYLPLQGIISKSLQSLVALGLKVIFRKFIFLKKRRNPLWLNDFSDFLNRFIFATNLPSFNEDYLKSGSIPCRCKAETIFLKIYFSLKVPKNLVALGVWRFSFCPSFSRLSTFLYRELSQNRLDPL